jgi:hypothetical protein
MALNLSTGKSGDEAGLSASTFWVEINTDINSVSNNFIRTK